MEVELEVLEAVQLPDAVADRRDVRELTAVAEDELQVLEAYNDRNCIHHLLFKIAEMVINSSNSKPPVHFCIETKFTIEGSSCTFVDLYIIML